MHLKALDEELTRIKTALTEGKPDEARARIQAIPLHASPGSERTREIGELFWDLGYPAMAGRYWYLLENPTDNMKTACQEFERSLGNNPILISKAMDGARPEDTFAYMRLREIRVQEKAFRLNHRGGTWKDLAVLLAFGLTATSFLAVFIVGLLYIITTLFF